MVPKLERPWYIQLDSPKNREYHTDKKRLISRSSSSINHELDVRLVAVLVELTVLAAALVELTVLAVVLVELSVLAAVLVELTVCVVQIPL